MSARAVARINDDHDGQYTLVALKQPGMYVNGDMTVDVIGGSAMSNGNVDRSGGKNAFKTDGTIDAYGFVNPNANCEPQGEF